MFIISSGDFLHHACAVGARADPIKDKLNLILQLYYLFVSGEWHNVVSVRWKPVYGNILSNVSLSAYEEIEQVSSSNLHPGRD